jgi:hypothetical protein
MRESSSWQIVVGEITLRISGLAGISPGSLRERALQSLLDYEPEPEAAPAAVQARESDAAIPATIAPSADSVTWAERLRVAERLGREAAALEAGGVAELLAPATDLRPRIWVVAKSPDGTRDSPPSLYTSKSDLLVHFTQRNAQGLPLERGVWIGLPSKREAEAWIRGYEARRAQP